MKTIPTALQNHFNLPWQTIAYCLKVVRTDAYTRGHSSHDHAFTIDGLVYEPVFNLSSLASSAGLSVDNMEMTVLPEGDQVLDSDLLNGKWDNASFVLFAVNYESLADSVVLKNGNLGQVQFAQTHYVVEFRSLKQPLQQTQGIVTSPTCRARLGDARCTKDLTAFTYSGTVTGVDGTEPKRIFTDTSRAEDGGWFAEGEITFLTGTNAGLSRKVKVFEAGGEISLMMSLPYAVAIGNTYTIVAGCRKREFEDCRDKFDNILNFQGEAHLPGLDALSAPGGAAAQAADVVPPVPGEPLPAGDGGP